jgi:hypothetical protein
MKLFSGLVPRWAIVLDVRVGFISGHEESCPASDAMSLQPGFVKLREGKIISTNKGR